MSLVLKSPSRRRASLKSRGHEKSLRSLNQCDVAGTGFPEPGSTFNDGSPTSETVSPRKFTTIYKQ